ncbi:AraC family transcriptional regulator ligand-binding domain-containing protein [Amorphus sp. 3PC139-8]|uniref:AraC family transcriptional regulator n=1 Tax=Amorphus sp. 3PC139-8 TaxID=2735676 RepID=UPI00345D59A6
MRYSNSVALTRAAGFGSLPDLLRERVGERALFKTFEREGLSIETIDTPHTLLPVYAVMRVFGRAGSLLGDRTFGFEVGERMTHRGFGLWVEHSILAATLGDALRRSIATIGTHQSDCRMELVASERHVLWQYVPPPLKATNHQHSDHILPPMLEFVRHYLGRDWTPEWIEMNYARDPDAALIEQRLQIPIRFGCHGVGIALRKEDLAARRELLPAAYKRIVTLREVVADVLLKAAPEPARSLSAVVALRLMDGDTDIEGAARITGLSVQSLQRRLRQKGFTYREIVDGARHHRAIRLLRETDLAVVEIALMLGYQEHPSFTRAFQRWTGVSPTAYRLANAPLIPSHASA